MAVLQVTCSHCKRTHFYGGVLVASRIEALSSAQCSHCGKCGAVVTLDADLPWDQELEPLPDTQSYRPSEATPSHPR